MSIGENQEKKLAEKSKDSPQKVNVDLTLLPLKEQKPGIIAWAKIAGHNWWPGNILSIFFPFFLIHALMLSLHIFFTIDFSNDSRSLGRSRSAKKRGRNENTLRPL